MNQKIIGSYAFNMGQILGRGAFGTVYLGQVIDTQESVAIKVIEKRFMNHQMQQQSSNEIRSLRALKNQNIVGLLDVIQTANNLYIISEFCEGGDLRSLVQQGPVPEKEIMNILKQLINAFQELQLHKIIHRDLTPANILMKDSTYKIADFGFAKQLESEGDVLQSVAGTPLYMAPQVLLRLPYTSKCDIWSIGIILYELATQKAPYTAQNIIDLMHQIKIPIKPPSQISPQLQDFISSCLQFKESDRINWEDIFSHQIFVPQPLSQDIQNVFHAYDFQTQVDKRQQQQSKKSLGLVQKNQNKLTHSYQSRMIQHYLGQEMENNHAIVDQQFCFVRFLFNILVYIEKHQQQITDVLACIKQNFSLDYESVKRLAQLRVRQLLGIFEGTNNWLALKEVKAFKETEIGMTILGQIYGFKETFYTRYNLRDDAEVYPKLQEQGLTTSSEQMPILEDLIISIRVCKQQIIRIINEMTAVRHPNLCILYMMLQTQSFLEDNNRLLEDVQFVQQWPEYTIIEKINKTNCV